MPFSYVRRPRRGLRNAAIATIALISWPVGQAALAQQQSGAPARPQLTQQQLQERKTNDSTQMILAGYPGSTYFAMANDIAAALGGSNDLRVLPVGASGGVENVRDLLFLRGPDLALVPANALAYASASASFGPGLPRRLTYIAQLYSEEVHIVVGPGIAAFDNLRGQKIAVPPEDGNAEFAIRDLLRRLKIEAELVKVAAPDAIDDVRSGALAALVLMGGKPLRAVAGLPKDGSLRLLPLPFAQAMGDGYSPSAFRSEDYPSLIPDGQTVDTVSVSAVLMANSAKSDESNRRIAKFVPAFFGALSDLAGPQWHPKWTEVNLAASFAGWSRFAAAEELLARMRREQTDAVRRSFDEFLTASTRGSRTLSPSERKQLFDEFVQWTRNSMGAPNQPARP